MQCAHPRPSHLYVRLRYGYVYELDYHFTFLSFSSTFSHPHASLYSSQNQLVDLTEIHEQFCERSLHACLPHATVFAVYPSKFSLLPILVAKREEEAEADSQVSRFRICGGSGSCTKIHRFRIPGGNTEASCRPRKREILYTVSVRIRDEENKGSTI